MGRTLDVECCISMFSLDMEFYTIFTIFIILYMA
jgi:hypothetical protein